MLKMLKRLKNSLWPADVRVLSDEEIRREIQRLADERGRDVVRRFARNQSSLTEGQYQTSGEIDNAFGGVAPWRS